MRHDRTSSCRREADLPVYRVRRTRSEITVLYTDVTQLKAAVAAAEAFAKGKAVDAEVERDSDAVKYDITVAIADGSKDVNVDAMGKATAD